MLNEILMVLMAIGAVVGGIDRICGNRLGYGEKFEEGFSFLGPTALSMAGMICLAPVLADMLGRVVIPLYRMTGVDPGMFGSLLAIDMGGYQLAGELAEDALTGAYAGIVVAAMFGCTVVFTIPMGMGILDKSDRGFFAKGIMLGLVTMPSGVVAGGLAAGLSFGTCLRQNLPVFSLSLLLLLGLWLIPEKMVRGFCRFAQGIRAVITAGLVLAAVEYLCGWNPIRGMAPLSEAMEVVSSIGIVMLGSLPVTEFLQRRLRSPFGKLGARLGMKPTGMVGLLIGLVSVIPVFTMYPDMDETGKIMNAAFLVSAASMLAAHLGFVVSAEPELTGALILGKSVGGAAAVAVTLAVMRRNGKRANPVQRDM